MIKIKIRYSILDEKTKTEIDSQHIKMLGEIYGVEVDRIDMYYFDFHFNDIVKFGLFMSCIDTKEYIIQVPSEKYQIENTISV